MTDGNTYAINKHLDEREDYDALQEVTTELEQAEARIEELEGKLARAVEALDGMVGLFSADAILRRGTHVNMELYNARDTPAELKGQADE